MEKQAYDFEIVTWNEIREEVKKVNAELASIIDKISPNKRYSLVKASYAFGDFIINEGVTFLPTKQGLISSTSEKLPKELKEKLSYSSIPLFITLQNANEVFVNSSFRAIPFNMFYPGSLLGLFESIDYLFGRTVSSKWCVSAGARNLFTLPKINEINGFKRLKTEFGLSSNLQPRALSDHWQMFREITRSKTFKQPWHNSVLFFTKDWLSNHHNDPHWNAFTNYLFKHAWHQAQFAISKIGLNLTWGYVANAISARNLKPPPYLADQVKHLLLIAEGRWPAFIPANTSDQVAPIRSLQQALTDVYMLKKYYPTMMHVTSLERETHLPMYYSLAYPTLLEGSPHKVTTSTLMQDLREIKLLIDTIKPVISDATKVEHDLLSKTQFDYFHGEEDKYGEILSLEKLISEDKTFVPISNKSSNQNFCSTSPFWNGCIRIKRKN